ncbi:hypothetical protein SAMN04487905_11620 [Actinopolyspora xinjiangensis]|uniref:Uncharacterized protein n=1 Tax=Actinopolyspora xinjiangensis TaxID=405564 RepID=A0A1H0WVK6_9ACTN|nr:hypothetical protein SAMN04487905_11620 [Actinopolyspora xinjiangensis]
MTAPLPGSWENRYEHPCRAEIASAAPWRENGGSAIWPKSHSSFCGCFGNSEPRSGISRKTTSPTANVRLRRNFPVVECTPRDVLGGECRGRGVSHSDQPTGAAPGRPGSGARRPPETRDRARALVSGDAAWPSSIPMSEIYSGEPLFPGLLGRAANDEGCWTSVRCLSGFPSRVEDVRAMCGGVSDSSVECGFLPIALRNASCGTEYDDCRTRRTTSMLRAGRDLIAGRGSRYEQRRWTSGPFRDGCFLAR